MTTQEEKEKTIAKIPLYFPNYRNNIETIDKFYEYLLKYYNINTIPIFTIDTTTKTEGFYNYGSLNSTKDKGINFKIEEFKKINNLILKTLLILKKEAPTEYLKYHLTYKKSLENDNPLDYILGKTMGGLKLDGDISLPDKEEKKVKQDFNILKDMYIKYLCFGVLATEKQIENKSWTLQKQ